MNAHSRHIVVGVIPGQSAAVVTDAARFAEAFDAELVCVHVDISRYPVAERPDGTEIAASLDPDLADDAPLVFDPGLEAQIRDALAGTGVRWSARALAGGAATELARLSDELDAAMIVVGTRAAGFRGTMHEFFSGSVAVQLAHHQHRPVVVIPVNPVGLGAPAPWQGEGA